MVDGAQARYIVPSPLDLSLIIMVIMALMRAHGDDLQFYCAQKETHIFNVAISNELFD